MLIKLIKMIVSIKLFKLLCSRVESDESNLNRFIEVVGRPIGEPKSAKITALMHRIEPVQLATWRPERRAGAL